MGAYAISEDHRAERAGEKDFANANRAKSLGITLLRPTTRASLTPPSFLAPLPHEVLVLDEGIAVATYQDDGAVQYGSLRDLLKDHGLDEGDLEVVERVRGVGRWSR